ncbi:hypothetical protein PG989_009434 [Apiospora arundinis]
MDEVISPDLGALIYEQIRKFIVRQAGGDNLPQEEETQPHGEEGQAMTTGIEPPETAHLKQTATVGQTVEERAEAEMNGSRLQEKGKVREAPEMRNEAVRSELAQLDRSYAAKVMYVVGKEQMKIKQDTSIFRRIILTTFLWIRENTRAKIANLRLSMDRVVEVGFVKEI